MKDVSPAALRVALEAECAEKTADLRSKLSATQFVCAERERELLELKGPCSNADCPLHYAHAGPCAPRMRAH